MYCIIPALFLTRGFFLSTAFPRVARLLHYKHLQYIASKNTSFKKILSGICILCQWLIETSGHTILPTMFYQKFFFSLWCCCANKHKRYSLNIKKKQIFHARETFTEHGCMAATTLSVLFQPATFVACHAALWLLNEGKMLKFFFLFFLNRHFQSTVCHMWQVFCCHGLQFKCNISCGYCMCRLLLSPVIWFWI